MCVCGIIVPKKICFQKTKKTPTHTHPFDSFFWFTLSFQFFNSFSLISFFRWFFFFVAQIDNIFNDKKPKTKNESCYHLQMMMIMSSSYPKKKKTFRAFIHISSLRFLIQKKIMFVWFLMFDIFFSCKNNSIY